MVETASPLRGCEECGGVDDHPRVVHPLPPGDPRAETREEIIDLLIQNGIPGKMLREIQDPNTVIRHHDCCAAAGCPVSDNDGPEAKSCGTHLKEVGGEGKTGDSLRKAIMKEAV